MSGPFALYVWAAYGICLVALAVTLAATLAAYRSAKRAVKDSETKP